MVLCSRLRTCILKRAPVSPYLQFVGRIWSMIFGSKLSDEPTFDDAQDALPFWVVLLQQSPINSGSFTESDLQLSFMS